jgi:hypothetical protein
MCQRDDHSIQLSPLPPLGFWGKLSVFNALEAGFYPKFLVLRNMEVKLLKMCDLREPMRAVERGATPRVYAENTTGATLSMILKSAFPRGLKPDASSRLLRRG